MKVLFISLDGLTDPLGQSQVIPYMRELSLNGHDICILSLEKNENFNKNSSLITSILNKDNIKWRYVSYSTSIPFFSQWFNYFMLKSKAKKLFKEYAFDIIHCRSYLPALIGLNFKKKYNAGFIFDMRGFWADERIDGGIWKKKNILHKTAYNFLKRKETEFISKADYVVSLTNSAKKEIESWNSIGSEKHKIEVIPCCCDEKIFSVDNIVPEKLTVLKNTLQISNNDFVVCYHGSLGTWYLSNQMLDFFKVIKSNFSNAKLLIVSQDDSAPLVNYSTHLNIPQSDLIFYKASRDEIPYLLYCSQLCLFFIKQSYSKIASSPTKLAEIMMMGKPYISNTKVGDMEEITEQSQSGYLVNDFNLQEYDKAITKIDKLLQIKPEIIINFAKNNFSLNTGAKKYNDIYLKFNP